MMAMALGEICRNNNHGYLLGGFTISFFCFNILLTFFHVQNYLQQGKDIKNKRVKNQKLVCESHPQVPIEFILKIYLSL
jgi:hypothetical protein